MRLVPRLAVPVIVLASLVAGCGGAQVTVEEVPGAPAELTVPGNAVGLAPAATVDAEATPTPAETPGADDSASSTTPEDPASGSGDATTQPTTPEGTEGGGAAAPGTEDGAGTDQAPPPGSDAEQFEDFCAQNPGAC